MPLYDIPLHSMGLRWDPPSTLGSPTRFKLLGSLYMYMCVTSVYFILFFDYFTDGDGDVQEVPGRLSNDQYVYKYWLGPFFFSFSGSIAL